MCGAVSTGGTEIPTLEPVQQLADVQRDYLRIIDHLIPENHVSIDNINPPKLKNIPLY